MSVSRPTSRSRRVLRRTAVAAATVAVATTLSACNPKEAGSAAVVGGYRITETRVQTDAKEVVAGVERLGGQPPASGPLLSALVSRMVAERLVFDAAVKESISVSQGDIDALIAKSGGRQTLEDKFLQNAGSWAPPSALDDQARVFLIENALAQKLSPSDTTAQAAAVTKYLTDVAAEVGVEIAARYGTWDPTKISLGPVPDDLSVPAIVVPSASSSPSG